MDYLIKEALEEVSKKLNISIRELSISIEENVSYNGESTFIAFPRWGSSTYRGVMGSEECNTYGAAIADMYNKIVNFNKET